MREISLDGRSLTPADVVAIARGRAEARMAPDARERNAAAERLVRGLLDRGELLYGASTGVGVLRSAPSVLEDAGDHQWRLLRSHAGGGGAPLTVEVVRAAMAVRANQLRAGGGAAPFPVEVVRAARPVRANQLGAGGGGVGEPLLDALLGALRAGVTPL